MAASAKSELDASISGTEAGVEGVEPPLEPLLPPQFQDHDHDQDCAMAGTAVVAKTIGAMIAEKIFFT